MRAIYDGLQMMARCVPAVISLWGAIASGADLFDAWRRGDLWKMSPQEMKNFVEGAQIVPVGDHITVYRPNNKKLEISIGDNTPVGNVYFYWRAENEQDMPKAEEWQEFWSDEGAAKDVAPKLRLARVTVDVYNACDSYSQTDDRKVSAKKIRDLLSAAKSHLMKDADMPKEKTVKEKLPNARTVERRLYEGEKGVVQVEHSMLNKGNTEYLRWHFVPKADDLSLERYEKQNDVDVKDLLKNVKRTSEGYVRLKNVPLPAPYLDSMLAVVVSQFAYYGIDDLENAAITENFLCRLSKTADISAAIRRSNSDSHNVWLEMGHMSRATFVGKWSKEIYGKLPEDGSMAHAPKNKVDAWWRAITSSVDAGFPVIVSGSFKASDRTRAGLPKYPEVQSSSIQHFQIIGYNWKKQTLLCMLPGDWMERELAVKDVYAAAEALRIISIQGKLRKFKKAKAGYIMSM